MKRVIVIGCPGSGKSTFARRLHERTGLPLIHLDSLYWRADKTHLTHEEFDSALAEAMRGDSWIIDGNYGRTMETRLRACDTVFFMDMDEEVCLSGIRERVGKPHPDLPWTEETLDPEFEGWVRAYRAEQRPKVLSLLEGCPEKEIHIFRARQALEDWLNK